MHQNQTRQNNPTSQLFRQGPSADHVSRATQEQNQFLQAGRMRQMPGYQSHDDEGRHVWAGDFQQSAHPRQGSTHSSQPTQFTQSHSQAPALGAWGEEFMAMHERQAPMPQQQPFLNQGPMYQSQQMMMGQPNFTSYAPAIPNNIYAQSSIPQESNRAFQVSEADQEILNKAFAEAEASLHRIDLDSPSASHFNPPPPPQSTSTSRTQLEEMQRLDPRETLDEMDKRHQSDALSTTAGQLIESLRDERSDKFKNSNFLKLMHQLRDKEVVVDDDKMISVRDGGEVKSHIAGISPDEDVRPVGFQHELADVTL